MFLCRELVSHVARGRLVPIWGLVGHLRLGDLLLDGHADRFRRNYLLVARFGGSRLRFGLGLVLKRD